MPGEFINPAYIAAGSTSSTPPIYLQSAGDPSLVSANQRGQLLFHGESGGPYDVYVAGETAPTLWLPVLTSALS